MANYSLVANSTFQPFTYQELAAPLDRQELYHEKLAEEYDKLSTQADVLEAMGQNDRDKSSGAYNRYKAYSDVLRKEADDLYRFGLNTESRQRLSDLRRRYNTEIVPIQNAWSKREKEADDQMKAQLQNPSLMFTRDAMNTTLDDYIRNPTGGYGVINGANITAQMAGMAKNLAKQVRSGNKQNIDDYTYNYIEKYGLDENLIRNWQDSPTLSAMFKQVMKANGVTEEALSSSANMQDILDKSTGYAEMGMWNAMGEDKSNIIENFEARTKYRYQVEHPDTPANSSLPGDTIDINFSDPESAGNQMKRQLATATVSFLQNSTNPRAKKMLDEWKDKGGIEAAIKEWETNGIDGKKLKKNGLYWALGNYIRDNVTKNEDVINIWRSDYIRKPSISGSTTQSTRGGYYPSLKVNSNPSVEGKNWGNIDALSNNGYKVKAVQLNDQETALKSWLQRTLDRNYREGKVKIYEIKHIKGDNTYEYGATTDISDLPHTSNGKEIDYGRIRRAMLSNGDYLLYWRDDSGNTQEKVLRRSEIGEQAVRDWQNTDAGYKSALNLYTQGQISKEEFDTIARKLGVTNMANAYLDMQEVKVKDYEVQ